jgi:hypothetical protein
VGGSDDVATVAASVLNGAIPELALNLDGTPETALSTEDKTLVEHALCRVLFLLIDAAVGGLYQSNAVDHSLKGPGVNP